MTVRSITSHLIPVEKCAQAESHGGSAMDRDEVRELHFITSIENLDSILRRGILSHNRAQRVEHRSVASEDVQNRRRWKSVPRGSSLHSYANLYFDARNPMMSRLLYDGCPDLIVLAVSEAVLDIPDTVVTDGNAAATGTRFHPSPEGLANLNSTLIFAERWPDSNPWVEKEKKRVRCAEVLVPSLIPSDYIEGCYVDSSGMRRRCLEFEGLPVVEVRRRLYFR
jgi:ssDNA thymidine ADP-ribosyltransferase DarT-like protein